MDYDEYLKKLVLLDCDGHASHTLILALDGSVEIEFRDGRRANVDVRNRINLTAHTHVHDALLQEAIAFGQTAARSL
jgi:hypothetical protein